MRNDPKEGVELRTGDFVSVESSAAERPPEESYYVNRKRWSRMLPSDIPQPEGKIYKG